jgi:Aromatic-ring hydroxylase, C-terminal/FAD binding domain
MLSLSSGAPARTPTWISRFTDMARQAACYRKGRMLLAGDAAHVHRVQLIDAKYVGTWELPALGAITAPTAVLIRPDGYVAWVGDLTHPGLPDALTTWFGPPEL